MNVEFTISSILTMNDFEFVFKILILVFSIRKDQNQINSKLFIVKIDKIVNLTFILVREFGLFEFIFQIAKIQYRNYLNFLAWKDKEK
jgi:hypothetical protein